MEIDRKINQNNADGQGHGYWANYYDSEKKQFCSKYHFFNGLASGYEENFDINGDTKHKLYWINNEIIGCRQCYNSQCFYKTPGKKFGEEIKWKKIKK